MKRNQKIWIPGNRIWKKKIDKQMKNLFKTLIRKRNVQDDSNINFENYQKEAMATAIYGDGNKVTYPLIGINGEIGEVCEKYKKHLRDGNELDKEDMTKELGDVLWYLAAIARDLEINLQDVADTNITKLKSRRERNVIHGDGDDR